MTEKKLVQKAEMILKNALVLTMNTQKEVFDQGTVVIKGKTIVAVGDASLLQQFQAEQVLDVGGDIVMPGLINAHTHVPMVVFRSLADDVPDRLQKYIFPLEKQFVSPEMVSIGAMLGTIEMLKSVVTTYADMYYFEDQVAEAVEKNRTASSARGNRRDLSGARRSKMPKKVLPTPNDIPTSVKLKNFIKYLTEKIV